MNRRGLDFIEAHGGEPAHVEAEWSGGIIQVRIKQPVHPADTLDPYIVAIQPNEARRIAALLTFAADSCENPARAASFSPLDPSQESDEAPE